VLTYLILGATYGFAAVVSPGPTQTYLVAQTLAHGWRRALPGAFAPLLSDGPIIALVLLVLAHMPPVLLQVLRVAGGLFLFWLAWGAWRTWRANRLEDPVAAPSGRRSLWQATVINLLNPGPYVGWTLVMGPLLLKGWREAPANGIALLAGFYGVMVLGMVLIVVAFAPARRFGAGPRRALVGLSALALAGFGAFLFWTAYAGMR
jgi:threonine/homoserine/homoserine lactone efflux protein